MLQTYGPEQVDTTEHRLLSLSVAEQAMTLLKNDGGLLPLKKTAKVAFLGPQANFTQQMLSNYEGSSIYLFHTDNSALRIRHFVHGDEEGMRQLDLPRHAQVTIWNCVTNSLSRLFVLIN